MFISSGDNDNDDNERLGRVDADFEVLDDDDNDIDADASNEEDEDVSCIPTPLPSQRRLGKLLTHYDEEMFGVLECSSDPSSEDMTNSERFDNCIRLLIRRLKITAARSTHGVFCPLTRRFLIIMYNADEEWMTEQVLSGIPISTTSVLGKEGFNCADLLSLHRWKDEKLCQKGVYLDVVVDPELDLVEPQLYVGLASGRNGLSQRWSDYVSCGQGSFQAAKGLRGDAIRGNKHDANL